MKKDNLIKTLRQFIMSSSNNDEANEKSLIRLLQSELGSGGNDDYNVTKQTVTLFNDTIETQEVGGIYQGNIANIDFDLVSGETYTVVFDGASYDVKAITSPFPGEPGIILGEIVDGGPSFESYPFIIMYGDGEERGMFFATPFEGSHTVVIKHEEETVTTTPEFKSAVDSVTGYSIDKENETLYEGTAETIDNNGYIYGIITPTITLVEGDTYKVTFNGIEYTCKCFNSDGDPAIGAPFDSEEEIYDWSIYPFNIVTYPLGGGQYETSLSTNQEGSYTLKIEHLIVSTKTTPKFVSMIQGIAGGDTSGCQIIYPDSISWLDTLYSQYNKEPEVGNIYFIPFADAGTPNGRYLYPVHIDELTNDDNEFSGRATIIGTPMVLNNGTLTALAFGGVINPSIEGTSGLNIIYRNDAYRLSYAEPVLFD